MRAAVPKRAFTAVCGLILWTGLAAVPPEALATDAAGFLARARALRDAGQLEEAAASIREELAAAQGSDGAAAATAAEAHRELGGIYEALKRPHEAAAHYEMSLAADPRQPALRYRAGILYRQLSEPGQAARHLEESFKQGFRNTGVRFHLAAAQFASGQFAAGLENARAILQRGSPSGGLAARVGRVLFQHLFYQDAIAAFEAALERPGATIDARLYLALSNFLLNRHERAIEVLEPAGGTASSNLTNAEALTLLASAHASLDRFAEAEELLQRAVATEPSSPHAYLNLAFVLIEQGKADAAERWLARMRSAAGPASPKVFYAIRSNPCDDAYREVASQPSREGPSKDPQRGLELFEFARSLAARHHYGTAVELLRLASRLASSRDLPGQRLLHALGFSCLNLAPESETPARLLQRSVELDPQRHESHFLLGISLARRGEPERAAAAFERAIALNPASAAYRTELGRLLSAEAGGDDRARAGEILLEAIAIDPLDASPRYELAKLRMGQGRLADAEAQLARAIEAEPEFHEAYYVLGQVYARQRRPEDARRHLQLFESKKAASEARSTVWKEAAIRLEPQ